MNRRLIILVAVAAVLLEAVLRSSHIFPFFDTEVIILAGLLFIIDGKTKLAVFFVIIASFLMELAFGLHAGISGLAFFLTVLLTGLLYRVNPVFDSERYVLRYAFTLFVAVVLKAFLVTLVTGTRYSFELPVILVNLACYSAVILLYERFRIPQSVLKN